MNVTIVKEFQFEAAHFLPNHLGCCKNIHGHSYRLQVGIVGEPKPFPGTPDEGMVKDFSDLKQIVNRHIVDNLDHTMMNNLFDLKGFPHYRPTAELMAIWMFEILSEYLPVKFIRLWETATSYAEVSA